MNKTKFIGFRLQELDFEYLRKMAIKNKITVSDMIRTILKVWLKRELKNLENIMIYSCLSLSFSYFIYTC